MEPVDRSTIWPYDERGEPGEFYYSRYAQPDRRRGGGAPRRARRRRGAALPVGQRRDDGARALAARAGRHDRARRRRVLRHRRHLPGAREVGPALRRVRPDRPAARRRAARLARGAVEPVPHDAGSRGCGRAPGPGRRRLDRRDPVHLRPLEHGADFALHSATKYLARPRRRAARRGRLPRPCRRRAADVPHAHRDLARAGPGVAPAARTEDARGPRAPPDRDGDRTSPSGCEATRRCRSCATRGSAA